MNKADADAIIFIFCGIIFAGWSLLIIRGILRDRRYRLEQKQGFDVLPPR